MKNNCGEFKIYIVDIIKLAENVFVFFLFNYLYKLKKHIYCHENK